MVTNLVILTREDRKNWYKLRDLLEGDSLDTAILVDNLKNNGLNNIHIKHFIVNYHSKRFGGNYEQIIFYTKKMDLKKLFGILRLMVETINYQESFQHQVLRKTSKS